MAAMSSRVPLSVLDLATVKVGGTVSRAFEESVNLARRAEELGYQRFWLAEHHNMPGIASSATAVLIGHVAGKTSRIRVGSGGVMLPNHPPIVIAEQFGTLEALYPGRIDLGLGRAPGSDQLTARALRRGPGSADDFPRQVEELKAFLAPAIEGQRVTAVPGAGSKVPIWLLGSSDFSAQLAAIMGLPYAFAAHFAPAAMWTAIAAYRAGFEPSPELPRSRMIICIPVVAAETDERARYVATSLQQRVLSLIRGKPLLMPPPVENMDALWDEREKTAVGAFLAQAIIGGPETVKRKIDAFIEGTQPDELMIASDAYAFEDRVRSYELIADAMGN